MKLFLSLRLRVYKTGCVIIGFTLFSLTALAQELPADTLKTESLNRHLLSGSTGSAQQYRKEMLNKGLITGSEKLLAGQVAGLQVIPVGGQAGAPAILRQHAVNTVFGDRAPLIVLDGMPIEDLSVSDFTGYLSLINPDDIASITFLTDAASVAVYGGRAANGILYITSKKSERGNRTRISYFSTAAISSVRRKADVLSADEFRSLVQQKNPDQVGLLGNDNTDWQDVIFRKAFSHDQNLSLAGSLFKSVPFRISTGHLNENEVIKTSQNKRNTLTLSLNPSLLQDHLKLNVNLRSAQQVVRVVDNWIIPKAWAFDPTQPVYHKEGEFFNYRDENGEPSRHASLNPLSILEQRYDLDKTKFLQGQAHVQYKFHFLPSLNVNFRYNFFNSSNEYKEKLLTEVGSVYNQNLSPVTDHNQLDKQVNQKELYLNYEHPKELLQTKISFLAGATISILNTDGALKETYNGNIIKSSGYYTVNKNESAFGKLSINHKGQYTFVAALNNESYSHFRENETASTYSMGAAWNVLKESFMVPNTLFSTLRLEANYASFAKPARVKYNAKTVIDPSFSPVEDIQNYQIGVAFGLAQEKLKGNISFIHSNLNESLALPLPIHNGFMLVNNSSLSSSGLQGYLQYQVFSESDLNWKLGANASYINHEIDQLMKGYEAFYYENLFVLKPGKPVNMFNMYEQLYDDNGKPLGGSYKLNKSGMAEKTAEHSAEPKTVFGFNSELNYKKFSLDVSLRGSTGNHVYSRVDAYQSYSNFMYGNGYLRNLTQSYLTDGFTNGATMSSHYIKDASFVRMEYFQVGYDFYGLWKDKATLRLTGTVQNAFVLTKYKGQDPEIAGGIDNGQSQNPTTFSLGLNLTI